jgi:hypothetical protein
MVVSVVVGGVAKQAGFVLPIRSGPSERKQAALLLLLLLLALLGMVKLVLGLGVVMLMLMMLAMAQQLPTRLFQGGEISLLILTRPGVLHRIIVV